MINKATVEIPGVRWEDRRPQRGAFNVEATEIKLFKNKNLPTRSKNKTRPWESAQQEPPQRPACGAARNDRDRPQPASEELVNPSGSVATRK